MFDEDRFYSQSIFVLFGLHGQTKISHRHETGETTGEQGEIDRLLLATEDQGQEKSSESIARFLQGRAQQRFVSTHRPDDREDYVSRCRSIWVDSTVERVKNAHRVERDRRLSIESIVNRNESSRRSFRRRCARTRTRRDKNRDERIPRH